MIPNIEEISIRNNTSFYVGNYNGKYFERAWHYHYEYELLYIVKGYGSRVVGDNTSRFKEGDLVLLGGNLPHAWYSDPQFFEPDYKEQCESIYLQFDRSIFGTRFADLPEMKQIQKLLNDAKLGLNINTVKNKNEIVHLIHQFYSFEGVDRLLNLIKLLDLFSKENLHTIASRSYVDNFFITKSERVKKVHEYVINNYNADISVRRAAEIANMNLSSFCRYFKRTTHKTFSQFVAEIRIDFAQQLLINTNLSSNQIGFECGFSSIAYFNQIFKKISGVSPLVYRAKYKIL